MYRSRIEKLEDRRLFSVTDLVIDPFQAIAAVSRDIREQPAMVDYIDLDQIVFRQGIALRTESVSKDESITIGAGRTENVAAGDVNGDGRATLLDGANGGVWRNLIVNTADWTGHDGLEVTVGAAQSISVGEQTFPAMGDFDGDGDVDGADYFRSQTSPHADGLLLDVIMAPSLGDTSGSHLIIVVCSSSAETNRLLPYLEQDNVYKISEGTRGIASVIDGTSNTIMFGEQAHFVAAAYVELRGASAGSSEFGATENGLNVDVWEHAYAVQHASSGGTTTAFPDVLKQANSVEPGASTNGIIAILIGLLVGPSNPNVVYVGGSRSSEFLTTDPQGPTYLPLRSASLRLADGSEHFLGTDAAGTMPMILASDEYFSRFSETIPDDEPLVATTYGRGDNASQVTHDEEFETWANALKFDRGYLSLGYQMSDILISSIRAGRQYDQVSNSSGGIRADGTQGTWAESVQSILHEDNGFWLGSNDALGRS